jgi:hypothetical protein
MMKAEGFGVQGSGKTNTGMRAWLLFSPEPLYLDVELKDIFNCA